MSTPRGPPAPLYLDLGVLSYLGASRGGHPARGCQ